MTRVFVIALWLLTTSAAMAAPNGGYWQAAQLARMTSSVCMAMANVDPQNNIAAANAAFAAFENGYSEATQSAPEVAAHWAKIRPAMQQLSIADYQAANVGILMSNVPPLYLALMELGQAQMPNEPDAPFRLLQAPVELLNTRMCMITVGLDDAESLSSLVEYTHRFDAILAKINAAPTNGPEADAALANLTDDWTSLKNKVAGIVAAGSMSRDQLHDTTEGVTTISAKLEGIAQSLSS